VHWQSITHRKVLVWWCPPGTAEACLTKSGELPTLEIRLQVSIMLASVGEAGSGTQGAGNEPLPVAGASRLSISVLPSSIRHSMDEYYHQETSPVDLPEAPPEYDEFLHSPALRRRFNIQPREDEGREILPPYSSAISLENVFMKKMELEGAVHKAQDRNWYRVMVTLQGTALTIHKCKSSGLFGGGIKRSKHTPDFPAGTTRGAFLRSYNLQHADVGIAADYLK
jgi:hypothetical protein